jgi:hypothetical protein
VEKRGKIDQVNIQSQRDLARKIRGHLAESENDGFVLLTPVSGFNTQMEKTTFSPSSPDAIVVFSLSLCILMRFMCVLPAKKFLFRLVLRGKFFLYGKKCATFFAFPELFPSSTLRGTMEDWTGSDL